MSQILREVLASRGTLASAQSGLVQAEIIKGLADQAIINAYSTLEGAAERDRQAKSEAKQALLNADLGFLFAIFTYFAMRREPARHSRMFSMDQIRIVSSMLIGVDISRITVQVGQVERYFFSSEEPVIKDDVLTRRYEARLLMVATERFVKDMSVNNWIFSLTSDKPEIVIETGKRS